MNEAGRIQYVARGRVILDGGSGCELKSFTTMEGFEVQNMRNAGNTAGGFAVRMVGNTNPGANATNRGARIIRTRINNATGAGGISNVEGTNPATRLENFVMERCVIIAVGNSASITLTNSQDALVNHNTIIHHVGSSSIPAIFLSPGGNNNVIQNNIISLSNNTGVRNGDFVNDISALYPFLVQLLC